MPSSDPQASVAESHRPATAPKGSLALYIHIPFCETKCPYCDFNTYAGIEYLIPDYVEALAEELRLWAAALGSPHIQSIFFGGGTPSYVPPEDIGWLLDTARSGFAVAEEAEVTLESNPGDVTAERLATWRKSGVNRLSIGVQSLDDGLLQLLGRRHSAKEATEAFHHARAAGFDNVNLDLMYGLPHQNLEQWRQTLEQTLALHPEHLSLYCLTLEEGTPLEARVRQGVLPTPDSDLAADMYELAEGMTAQEGYQQYEISNWALPGRACSHNLIYWRNQPYLGVGPGAHSSLNGHRFANLRSPRQYVQRVHRWAKSAIASEGHQAAVECRLVEMVEAIDGRLEMGETMMLGLRLTEGIAENSFRARFGVELRDTFGPSIHELEGAGLLQWHDGSLVLTPHGRLLGNEVFQRFLA